MTTHTVPSLSGIPMAIGSIPTRLTLNPKMPKEPSSPSRSNALTPDPDKTKICGKLRRKWLIMKEAKCLTIIFILISFICNLYSQNVELLNFQIKRDYSKNSQKIDNCLDKIQLNGDTLIIDMLTEISSFSDPPLKESIELKTDTLFLNYTRVPQVPDTIIKYDSTKQKYDTLLTLSAFTIGVNNDYFSKLTYKIGGFSDKPKKIYFHERSIDNCPTKLIAYDLVNGDTVNVINSNGWKDGVWISTIETDSINSTKIKYYDNRKFIKGYIITEGGDTTHCIGEACVEVSIPYEICKQRNIAPKNVYTK